MDFISKGKERGPNVLFKFLKLSKNMVGIIKIVKQNMREFKYDGHHTSQETSIRSCPIFRRWRTSTHEE